MMQPTSTQQNVSYHKREKKVLSIVDPNTGQPINLESVGPSKTSSTPPQSGTASSRDTPVSHPDTGLLTSVGVGH